MLASDVTQITAHFTKMSSTAIKDSLLHNRPQLSGNFETNVYVIASSACCHNDIPLTTTRLIRYLFYKYCSSGTILLQLFYDTWTKMDKYYYQVEACGYTRTRGYTRPDPLPAGRVG